MTTCPYCESNIADGLKFCPSCGAALLTEPIVPQATQQPVQQPAEQQGYWQQNNQAQGNQTQAPYTAPQTEVVDSGSVGWAVLGFIIPIVGIILFFVWHKTKPKCANMAIIGAAISIVLSMIIRFSGVLGF